MNEDTKNLQVVSFFQRVKKDIRLHLDNGEKIDIPLWDTQMIDMGNGHLFVIGKVVEKDNTSLPEDQHLSAHTALWKR
jgi:hypothetical protein